MAYELQDVNFDLKGNAPPGQQWADVQITMAVGEESFHKVSLPVLVPSDASITMGELRQRAFEEARKLVEAIAGVLSSADPNEVVARQDAEGAERDAKLAQMEDPELLSAVAAGDPTALDTWRKLAG